MDAKNARELDNCGHDRDLKMKHVAASAADFGNACGSRESNGNLAIPSLVNKHDNTVRMECKTNVHCRQQMYILKNYQNFMKTGLPQRILFCENGEWIDFPGEIVGLVRDDFLKRKAISEVVIKGEQLLLDFVHMTCIDSVRGESKPIAWIDVDGKCFFPESSHIFSSSNGLLDCRMENCVHTLCKTKETQELRESPSASKSSSCYKADVALICNVKRHGSNFSEVMEEVGENDPCALSPPNVSAYGFAPEKKNRAANCPNVYNTVQNLLFVGLGQYLAPTDIVGIFRTPLMDKSGEVRIKRFQEQVEITRSLRGNANVRYAWIPSSKDAIEDVMLNGNINLKMLSLRQVFGTGLHLVPANRSDICVSSSDVDENGMVYMLLCRVIMGNVEVIRPGSEQFQPSDKHFDCGVDNLHQPERYVVWNMHVDSHIYPEYVVIVNLPTKAKDCLVGKEIVSNVSGVTNSVSSQSLVPVKLDPLVSSVVEPPQEKPRLLDGASKMPASPWMPFSMLFAAISSKVSSHDMELISAHYEEFKNRKVSRIDFVKRLRQIIGDQLLISTITKLRHKLPFMANHEHPKPWYRSSQLKS